jgi:hypothetical protein
MALACSGCNLQLGPDASRCPNCGARVAAASVAPPEPVSPPGPPICVGCGLIAALGQDFCPVCDAAIEPRPKPAPGLPPGLTWAALAVRFECRACRQLAPLNHLDLDGQIRCMHCGVEQRFDVTRWQQVIEQVHTVADLAGPIAEARGLAAALGSGSPYDCVGRTTAFDTTNLGGLELRSGPGHPLCEQCLTPLRIADVTPTALTVICPECSTQRSYATPPQASDRIPALRGVVCTQHEVGRREVQLEAGAGGSVAIRCGNCSAPLPIPEGKSIAQCKFCGVDCRITPEAMWRMGIQSLRADWWWLLLQGSSRTRSRLEETARQIRKQEQDDELSRELQAAVGQNEQPQGVSRKALSIIAVLVVLLIGIPLFLLFRDLFVAVSTTESSTTEPPTKDGTARDTAKWNGVSPPLVHDVNRDGVFDIVGSVRTINPNDTIQLAAFDGRDGTNLWRTEAIGRASEVDVSKLEIVGDSLLYPQAQGGLRAFAVLDGTARFNIRLSENIERFCGAPQPGFAIVETKDRQHHRLSLANGATQNLEAAHSCQPIERLVPALEVTRDAPTIGDDLEGIASHRTIRLPGSSVLLALGNKAPGTAIPNLAAFRWPTRTKKRTPSPEMLWITDVPGVDPLSAKPERVEIQNISLEGDVLAVAYAVQGVSHRYRVTAVSLASGKHRWDTANDDDSPLSGVVTTPHHVLVSRWGGLFAFDRETGTLAYKIR